MSLSYGAQASNKDGLINESVDLKQVDRRDVVFVFFVEPHQHSFLKIISFGHWTSPSPSPNSQVQALLIIHKIVKYKKGKINVYSGHSIYNF